MDTPGTPASKLSLDWIDACIFFVLLFGLVALLQGLKLPVPRALALVAIGGPVLRHRLWPPPRRVPRPYSGFFGVLAALFLLLGIAAGLVGALRFSDTLFRPQPDWNVELRREIEHPGLSLSVVGDDAFNARLRAEERAAAARAIAQRRQDWWAQRAAGWSDGLKALAAGALCLALGAGIERMRTRAAPGPGTGPASG